jgi:serine/threonine-protein kinase HipA
MCESRLVDLDGQRHFMTKRFDREGSRRLHVQTLCALQHLPPGSPRSLCSYDALFDTAEALGLTYGEKEELFRRMAFNVYNREMDDHTKNFSFLMTEDGKWHLAPAYDLTGCHFSAEDTQFDDWQNQHALSVNGKFSRISDGDILAVAEKYVIGTAPKVLSLIRDVFSD